VTSEPVLLVEKSGGVCRLTLNRPRVLNAINRELGDRLLEALEACALDDDVRAIVLAGAGRAFCAGDDIKEGVAPASPAGRPEAGRPPQRRSVAGDLRRVNYFRFRNALRSNPKPVVARVQGYAYGAGLDLVLASDLAIAADDAKLAAIYVRHGMIGSVAILPRYVGLKKAMEMLLSGEPVDAPQAAALGLINYAVPPDELDATVDAWAAKLAAGPTALLSSIKFAVYRGVDLSFEDAMAFESVAISEAGRSEDQREGRASFVEKRPARFTGR